MKYKRVSPQELEGKWFDKNISAIGIDDEFILFESSEDMEEYLNSPCGCEHPVIPKDMRGTPVEVGDVVVVNRSGLIITTVSDITLEGLWLKSDNFPIFIGAKNVLVVPDDYLEGVDDS